MCLVVCFRLLVVCCLLANKDIPGGPKKRPELCITITACILYGAKFPLVHLQISVYYYLVINFSDVMNAAL